MSKKYNFSVSNNEVFELEKASIDSDLPIISIIRQRYEYGKTAIDFEKAINRQNREISLLKNDIEELKNCLSECMSMMSKQLAFINLYCQVELKNRPKLKENPEELDRVMSTLKLHSETFSNSVKNTFKKNEESSTNF